MTALKAGALYFIVLYAAGWVLGPVRELLITPRWGRVAGLLIESPFMIAAMFLAARWLARRFDVATPGARLAMGLIAALPLPLFEAALDMAIGGLSVARVFAGYATTPGLIGLALIVVLAAMPLLVGRGR